MKSPIFIAEVKTQSPFGYRSKWPWINLFGIAKIAGDWISVHTDPLWGGSFDLITQAKGMTEKPILAKGWHRTDEDIDRALAAGADYVLVVGRVPGRHLDRCLIEPLSMDQLLMVPREARAVWNARDLKTGGWKDDIFHWARGAFPGWLCQASGITGQEDVHPGADAILVGEWMTAYARSLLG